MTAANRQRHPADATRPETSGRQAVWPLVVLVAACLAAYSNSFSGPLVFDDCPSIQANDTIRDLMAIGQAFSLSRGTAQTVEGRPLLNFSLAVNYAISGAHVWSYHAVNLIIHCLASLVLYGLVRRTLLLPALARRYGRHSTFLALTAGLLWALHPLQTESVTYIIQRAESMMGLCYLLTLYLTLRGATSRRPTGWYVGAIVACFAGMAVKEVMATAPIMVLLYDRIFLSGSFAQAWRQRWRLYLGLGASWAFLAALVIPSFSRGGTTGYGQVPFWQYPLTQTEVILHYLRLILWPSPLVLDYGWIFAKSLDDVLPSAIALSALLILTIWLLVRRPMLGYLAACFFVVLAPSSSIVPIEDAAFEHRLYLPLTGVVVLAVIGLYELWRRWLARPRLSPRAAWLLERVAPVGVLVVLASSLAAATWHRNQDYQSAEKLWTDTMNKRPDNPRTWSGCAKAYEDTGRYDLALRCFDRGIQHSSVEAWYGRAAIYEKMGDYKQVIDCYDRAIALRPSAAGAYNNRADARLKRGDPAGALRDCDMAIQLDPTFATAYQTRAETHLALRQYDKAWADLDRATKLGQPPDAQFLAKLQAASSRPTR